MIDLYTWPTPNGDKVHIALEELGLAYEVHAVDIGAGDQFKPEFLKISPNNRIPAIVDRDGPGGKQLSMFESGAILIYLAEKTGKLLAPKGASALCGAAMADVPDGRPRPDAGPGQPFPLFRGGEISLRHRSLHQRGEAALQRVGPAARRNEYLAGADYTIADIATYPWLRYWEMQGVNLPDYANVQRWFDQIDARPGCSAAWRCWPTRKLKGPITDAQREILFGSTQVPAAVGSTIPSAGPGGHGGGSRVSTGGNFARCPHPMPRPVAEEGAPRPCRSYCSSRPKKNRRRICMRRPAGCPGGLLSNAPGARAGSPPASAGGDQIVDDVLQFAGLDAGVAQQAVVDLAQGVEDLAPAPIGPAEDSALA